MVEGQFLSNRSAPENGGQWFFNLPLQAVASSEPPKELGPTHMVSCGGGNRWCLGFYDSAAESWRDFIGLPVVPPGPPTPGSLAALCTKWGDSWDVPGGDYNKGAASRNDFKGCVKQTV
jgi:hypothetical protein